MRGRIKYVGFDKDGTLVDSITAYTKIWGQLFHDEYGLDKTDSEIFFIQTFGQPTTIQVDTLLRKNNIILSEDEVFKKANEIASTLGEKAHSTLFSEVPGMLKTLKERGYKIFVSSGHQESIVKNDLKKHGLIEFVDFFAGIRPADPTFKKGAPHFRAVAEHFGIPFEIFVQEAVFVGDSSADVEVSRNSHITSIVRKNRNADESLLEKGAAFVLRDFSNLPDIISTL